jgi:CheY-like chemotaxis protein
MPSHSSILLIEDSPGECELFRLALTQTGLDVALYTEHDAEAAFHFLLEDRAHHYPWPTLIVLDLQLYGQNGCDFLKRLRSDARFAAIPVVIFTTSDDPADLARCYANGANGYVVKPGTFEQLVQCVGDIGRYWIDRNLTAYPIGARC